MTGLQPGHVTVRLRGSAGQSLGAFAVQGLKLEVFGDANDYVGKGLSGGTIVVRPATVLDRCVSHQNTIIGNTVLYGATAGRLFAAGQAGERFAVRNSGADGGGRRLRLQRLRIHDRRHGGDPGPGRRQFRRRHSPAAWPSSTTRRTMFEQRINPDTVLWQRVAHPHWEQVLRDLVARHAAETNSRYAAPPAARLGPHAAALLADRAQGIREAPARPAGRSHGRSTARLTHCPAQPRDTSPHPRNQVTGSRGTVPPGLAYPASNGPRRGMPAPAPYTPNSLRELPPAIAAAAVASRERAEAMWPIGSYSPMSNG